MNNLKPDWLKKKIFFSDNNQFTRGLLKENKVFTVCQEARCPNQSECFHEKVATFLILGNICTRNCKFCSVESNNNEQTLKLDVDEAKRVAQAVDQMNLKYVVITSVTRDDLEDGGSGQFVKTIKAIRNLNKLVKCEVLTPDFNGNYESIKRVVLENPEVYNHNLETIERITPLLRSKSSYTRSLYVLEQVKKINAKIFTKSGIMLGLGETKQEVLRLFQDLVNVGCDIITIGQYLQATKCNYPVQEYVSEDIFKFYKDEAIKLGFKLVFSSPFVRSSYNAYKSFESLKLTN
ncbi:MAG: lipoyl synthase [Spirochaetota bacterium]|nr:lipoyl synthase [Spirochaetota bacterium]